MKSSNRVVKYGKFYERKNQYEGVIFQDGSDDLPPGVSEGRYLLYEGGINYAEKRGSLMKYGERWTGCVHLFW